VASVEIKAHWTRVAALRCLISTDTRVTLHHCHGGSMIGRGVMRMKGRKTSDWLVIPIAARFHTGRYGIDMGSMSVDRWERLFGTQAGMLDLVCARLGYDVWGRAASEWKSNRIATLET
jgi:hypothetical protein